jgi:UDP-N-acetylglucosamine:LPS N-acetylglucosamine transferase
MSRSVVLSLAVVPLRRLTGWAPVRTVQVYYSISSPKENPPKTFDPYSSEWTLCESRGDFENTNEVFNRMLGASVGGKSFLDFMTYRDVSMWQFAPSYIWPAFFVVVQMIDVLSQIIDNVRPQEIRALSSDDYTNPFWMGVVSAAGDRYGMRVVSVTPPIDMVRDLPKELRQFLRRIGVGRLRRLAYQVGRFGETIVYSRIRAERNELLDPRRKLILLTQGRRHWVRARSTGAGMLDEQFYPLLPALRRSGWTRFIMVDCDGSSPNEIRARMRNEERDVIWRSFSFYRKRRDSTLRRASRHFARKWEVLQHDEQFCGDFEYRGLKLMPALRHVLELTFRKTIPECSQMLCTADRILEERPGAVIATYETGPHARSVLIQAARTGIPTVGLQHGNIFAGHNDYMHASITKDPTFNQGFVVPQVMCVWGPYWKDVLTKSGHYPPDTVVVTGNWRYDWLAEVTDASDAKFMSGVGNISKRTVILIVSSAIATLDFLSKCLQELAALPGLMFVIKPHPGSDNPRLVRKMLQENGYQDVVLVQGQIGEWLQSADLVISQISTVVTEAVLLDKPVILANFLKIAGAEPYVDAGVCLYITAPSDLKEAVDKIMNDQATFTRLKVARQAFLSQYFFRIDGKSGQRVAETLESLLEKQGMRDNSK